MLTKIGVSIVSDPIGHAKMWKDRTDVGIKGGLLAFGAGFALKQLINKIQNDTRRKAIIEDLMLTDPIIKSAPTGQALSFYATINNIAPSIALDKNVVRELLQQAVKFGTIDIKTVKDLSDTQSSINKNKGMDFERFFK